MLPGEAILQAFRSDREALTAVVRRNTSIFLGIMVVIFVPFMILIALGPNRSLLSILPFEAIFLVLILFFAGMMFRGIRQVSRRPTNVATVTNRRVIIQHFGKNPAPSIMFLESVGGVEVDQRSSAAKKRHVAWVYVLPQGVSSAMEGSGKNRHLAGGVLYLPAVPIGEAQQMRNLITSRAQAVQAAFAAPAVRF